MTGYSPTSGNEVYTPYTIKGMFDRIVTIIIIISFCFWLGGGGGGMVVEEKGEREKGLIFQ